MEFEAYALGFFYASVCTSLSPAEAGKLLNEKYPTGLPDRGNGPQDWKLSKENFRTGEKNGCACTDHTGNKHYLFQC